MTPYGAEFYRTQMDRSVSSARKIVPYVIDLCSPHSVADIGCGVGGWLAEVNRCGVEDIAGFDGNYIRRDMLKIPSSSFHPWNLEEPLDIGRRFDLAISLEVAEHLPASSADTFVRNLTGLADVILYSAAIPGQGGVEHVNEQWPEYWIEKFAAHGYRFLDCIRRRFWSDPDVEPWYCQNGFLFVKTGCEDRVKGTVDVSWDTFDLPPRTVHPSLYQYFVGESIQNIYFSRAVKILPGLFVRAVRSRMGLGGDRAQ